MYIKINKKAKYENNFLFIQFSYKITQNNLK